MKTHDGREDDLGVEGLSVVKVGEVGGLEGAGRREEEEELKGQRERKVASRKSRKESSQLSRFSSVQSSGELTVKIERERLRVREKKDISGKGGKNEDEHSSVGARSELGSRGGGNGRASGSSDGGSSDRAEARDINQRGCD